MAAKRGWHRLSRVEQLPELRDIADDVAMTKHNAFRFAGGAACKEQCCFRVTAFASEFAKAAKANMPEAEIDIIHHKRIWRFIRGSSSSRFKTPFRPRKILQAFHERRSPKLRPAGWRALQQDSFAARPIVKLRSTGTLSASVTARLATIDPLLAGKTIAMRSSENSFRR